LNKGLISTKKKAPMIASHRGLKQSVGAIKILEYIIKEFLPDCKPFFPTPALQPNLKGAYQMNDAVNQLIKNSSWLSGNITPISWYQHIRTAPTKTKPTGSPDAIAVSILADIMYWYRPTEIRDEATGNVIGYKEKFAADKLQKSYQSYSDLFGVSKQKVKQSFDLLVKLNLITREFRTIDIKSGLKLSNVMFIEPIIENVSKISTPCKVLDTPSPQKDGVGSPQKMGGGSHKKRWDKYKDYTKITTNNERNAAAVDHIDDVFMLIPDKYRKQCVKNKMNEALNNGVSKGDIYASVLYANEKSTGGTWQKYSSFLGRTIDMGWANGWEPEPQEDPEQKKAAFLESRRRMPDSILKTDAENGCMVSAQVLRERRAKK
jgi:hypothetical protein